MGKDGGGANFRFLICQKSYHSALIGPIWWPICSLPNFGLLLAFYIGPTQASSSIYVVRRFLKTFLKQKSYICAVFGLNREPKGSLTNFVSVFTLLAPRVTLLLWNTLEYVFLLVHIGRICLSIRKVALFCALKNHLCMSGLRNNSLC